MRKLVALVIGVAMLLNLMAISNEVKAENNKPSKWFEQEIQEAKNNGFFIKELEGDYKRTITREEYVALAMRMLKLSENDIVYADNIIFTDIQSSDYYIDIINAYNNNLINGYPDNTFRPEKLITRQEMAKLMLNLVWKLKPELISYKYKNKFEDSELISRWAEEAVNYCAGINVIKGELSGDLYYLRPNNSATVEQAIVIMYRLGKFLDVINEDYNIGKVVITKYEVNEVEGQEQTIKTEEKTDVINEFALNVGQEVATKLRDYINYNKLELTYMDAKSAVAIDKEGQKLYISNYIKDKVVLSIYVKDTDSKNNMYKIFEKFAEIANVNITKIEAEDNTGDVSMKEQQYKFTITF